MWFIPVEDLACYVYLFSFAHLHTHEVQVSVFDVIQVFSYLLSPFSWIFFFYICMLLSIEGYHSYFWLASFHNIPWESFLKVWHSLNGRQLLQGCERTFDSLSCYSFLHVKLHTLEFTALWHWCLSLETWVVKLGCAEKSCISALILVNSVAILFSCNILWAASFVFFFSFIF